MEKIDVAKVVSMASSIVAHNDTDKFLQEIAKVSKAFGQIANPQEVYSFLTMKGMDLSQSKVSLEFAKTLS